MRHSTGPAGDWEAGPRPGLRWAAAAHLPGRVWVCGMGLETAGAWAHGGGRERWGDHTSPGQGWGSDLDRTGPNGDGVGPGTGGHPYPALAPGRTFRMCASLWPATPSKRQPKTEAPACVLHSSVWPMSMVGSRRQEDGDVGAAETSASKSPREQPGTQQRGLPSPAAKVGRKEQQGSG